ncbi:MAG: hypothetical protein ACLFO2_02385 [Candidatus Woesearchaeota archaeon]
MSKKPSLLAVLAIILVIGAIGSFIYLKISGNQTFLFTGIGCLVVGFPIFFIEAKRQERFKREDLRHALAGKYDHFALYSNFSVSKHEGLRFPKKVYTYINNQEIPATCKTGLQKVSYTYKANGTWTVTMTQGLKNLGTGPTLTCEKDGQTIWTQKIRQEPGTKKMNEDIPFTLDGQRYTCHLRTKDVGLTGPNTQITLKRAGGGLVLDVKKGSPALTLMTVTLYTLLYKGSILGAEMDETTRDMEKETDL